MKLCVTGLSVMVDDCEKIAYCFKGLSEKGEPGCMRVIRAAGGPGYCNAEKQKSCFYPKDFDCKCTPNRRNLPGEMRK